MFAIPWNFPFRKKDGSMSTLDSEISAGGGGGGSYTLPTASAETKGGIKIGAGLTMDGEVLNNANPTPATPYTLPAASAETLGGVKVGTGLSVDENGVLSASGGGGSTLYRHDIRFKGTDYAAITIINDSSTAFDETTLKTYLLNKGYTTDSKGIMATGKHSSDMILVLYCFTATPNNIKIFTTSNSNYDLAYSSINDYVVAI